MADKVIFQTNDGLTEQNLKEWMGQSSVGDYVESGLNFTADFTNTNLDISDGKAHVFNTAGYGQDITTFPDARTNLALTDNTTNYVFLAVDTSNNDSLFYHIDTDNTPPADPHLLIGVVDTSDNTVVEKNRQQNHMIGGSLVVGGPRGEFQTIQGAIDWANQDGAWNQGNLIIVGKHYDESNETWPVTVTTRCEINGTVADAIEPSDNTVPAFDIDLGGSGTDVFNRPPGVAFRNLEVIGGDHCFKNTDSRWSVFINCHAEDPSTNGFHFTSDPGYAVNSHTMIRCTFDNPAGGSGHGVMVGNAVHSMQMFKCSIRNAGDSNVRILNMTNFAMYGGGVQASQDWGVHCDAPHTALFDGVYFENNYKKQDNAGAELMISGNGNINVRQSYFNGMSNVKFGIRTFSGDHITVRDCSYRGYTSKFIFLDSADDVDVNRTTHKAIDGTGFGGAIDTGKRPRSEGVVGKHLGGVDLSTHSGSFIGDIGMDNGTNTPSGRPELAVWVDTTGDGSGDAWQVAGTENTI